ncbi:hypothetical protein CDL15_Pgr014570 [Punica granatum]|uniref:Protein NRT1/ PTR FAMILY 5.8-like n=1 Tax=Punica granatum TaxID=22663 RepID=A0A218WDE1_PUNGR|nr:hypothetical protein CDL15_Pgr014570 [Punica granatum]
MFNVWSISAYTLSRALKHPPSTIDLEPGSSSVLGRGGTNTRRTLAALDILGLTWLIAGLERFVFKGVASNLVTYLTDVMEMRNSSAAKMVSSWCGLTSILPLFIAPLADSYWDRYSTVLAFSFLYVLGLTALTSTAMATAWSPENKSSSAFLFSSLCLISVGLGGYNPSLQAFATDQLEAEEEELPCTKDERGPPDKKSQFFKWNYFGVCSGCLLGITVLSYIQDTIGWVIGFSIPTGAMAISIALFCCGNRIYAHKQVLDVDRRPFTWIVKAIKAAATKMVGSGIKLPDEKSELGELELQEKPLCHHNVGITEEDPKNGQKFYMLKNAKVVLRLLPIWITLLMFAVIFQQPATFFTKQGMVMRRTVGRGSFKIPPATLQSTITLSIILLMPLYDKMLIPIVRIFTRNEKGMNVMQRMGIGMFLTIVAMVIAAQVETKRLEIAKGEVGKPSPLTGPNNASLSIFWLLPQYIILGMSDVFTVVGMQEFFYREVPLRMRTMGFALYTSVFGVGGFLSALMISIIESITRGHSWFSDNMNEARLDKYYWLLALGSALSLLLYIAFCKLYRSRSNIEDDSFA